MALRRSLAACLALAACLPASATATQPELVARAMQADVAVEVGAASDRPAFASGVILQLRDGLARIATARHVVDRRYAASMRPELPALDTLQGIQVVTFDGIRAAASVEWLAPHGTDLAILSARLPDTKAQAARWDRAAPPQIGAAVFGLGSRAGATRVSISGTLARLHEQKRESSVSRILQSNLRIGRGDSGGGLYDAEWRLIGIHSMASIGGDPRFPNGIGMSTSLATLLDLAPQHFAVPPANP